MKESTAPHLIIIIIMVQGYESILNTINVLNPAQVSGKRLPYNMRLISSKVNCAIHVELLFLVHCMM